jgi:protocatechuate 3,4-dioxygenase beta subunit
MPDSTRRSFLRTGIAGLGLASIADPLRLRADAQPTIAIASDSHQVPIEMQPASSGDIVPSGALKKITPVTEGPFYRRGAPFRAKLCPPGEPGTTFVLTGRVWALDTRRPLAGAVLDFWHVDAHEKYSDGVTDFRNRGRLLSSETGAYELESIRPIPYRPNPGNGEFWRCAHFHLRVDRPGYRTLVTEIHFQDDPRKSDPMYRPENAIAVEKRTANGTTYEIGMFDIVLEPVAGTR